MLNMIRSKIYLPNTEQYWFVIKVTDNLIDCKAVVETNYRLDPLDGSIHTGSIGVVKFKPDSFTVGVISHEALHMALSMMRTFDESYELDEVCDDVEERIAWLTGYFAAKITNFYYDHVEVKN
jgi:hypothetical protein